MESVVYHLFYQRFFLREGFTVIFLHRTNSLRPFHQHFIAPNLLDRLEINQSDNTNMLSFKPSSEQAGENLINLYREYNEFKDKLLLIDYFSVMDYLYLLIEICQLLKFRRDSLIFLAAAVSDFYLPVEETVEHKIQSNQMDSLKLSLKPVPKLIQFLKTTVCPDAFIVSFKLETDDNLLIKKAQDSLKQYGHDLVISNSLSCRKEQVIFVDKSMAIERVSQSEVVVIEAEIVGRVVDKFNSSRY